MSDDKNGCEIRFDSNGLAFLCGSTFCKYYIRHEVADYDAYLSKPVCVHAGGAMGVCCTSKDAQDEVLEELRHEAYRDDVPKMHDDKRDPYDLMAVGMYRRKHGI